MIPTVPFDIVAQPMELRISPQVSIVTPAFNPEADLAVTVRALNAQTLRAFEWILVDDCSAGDRRITIEQARQQAMFPTTVLRHRSNCHQGQARNTGLTQSRAPFVKFLDADDALDSTHIESLLAAALARRGDRIVVFAPTRHLFLARNKIVDNHSYRDVGPDSNAQLVRMLTAPFMHHCGALFPRALLNHLGGYEPSLVTDEDGDLLLRVLLSGWRFEAVPEAFYLYRHHEGLGRVSRDDTPEKIAARRRVCDRVLAHFDAAGAPVPADVRRALCRRLDALAVRSWCARPGEALDLLAVARALDASYDWSGSAFERAVRRLAGIGTACRVISTLRSLAGVLPH